MSKTGIEWTDATWNPVTGCSVVSPGCAHCYAEAVALRFWSTQYPLVEVKTPVLGGNRLRPREFADVQCHEARLDQPLKWKLPRRIFVNSMSDLFHEDVPDAFIDRVFAVMALAPQHTFQVLTKRAERMRDYMRDPARHHDVTMSMQSQEHGVAGLIPSNGRSYPRWPTEWPLRNVWLGTSVENQPFADKRIPLLLQTPAAVRFISAEPLLEGLDLAKHRPGALGLHWCIVGGESGPGARPCETWWIRSIVRQCQQADVAVFVKQLGANVHDRNDAGFEGDAPHSWPMDTDVIELTSRNWQGDQVRVKLTKKGGDMSEWPKDLRIRSFPKARA